MENEQKQSRHKQFNKGYRKDIMSLLLEFGVVTTKSLKLLERNQIVLDRCVKILEDEGVIECVKFKSDRKVYRCLRIIDYERKSKNYISDFPTGTHGAYKKYAEDNGKRIGRKSSDIEDEFRKERIARLGDIGAMCFASDIRCMPADKTAILRRKQKITDGLYFFTNAEIKGSTGIVCASRMQGILISSEDIFITYHTGQRRLRWSEITEGQGCRLGMMAANEYRDNVINTQDVRSAVVFGEPKIFQELFTNTSGTPRLNGTKEKSNLLKIPSGYNELLFIPNTINGKTILRSMGLSNWRRLLIDKYLTDCSEPYLRNGIPHDGRLGTTNVLLFCIPDIEKLYNFVHMAKWQSEPDKFLIRCYKWQREDVLAIAGGSCKVEVVEDE